MHDYFAAWLRGVNVQLTDDVAKSRWAAVESLVQWVTESEKALHLAASAVAVASVNSEWRKEISRALQQGDASFPMMGNDAELQVLAASAVAQLFEDEGAVTDVAALGVATGTFGDREPEAAPGLAPLAREHLRRRALSVQVRVEARHEASFTVGQARYLTKLSNDVSKALAEEKDQGSVLPETVEVLNEAVSKLKDYVTELANAEFRASGRMIESLTVLSEENKHSVVAHQRLLSTTREATCSGINCGTRTPLGPGAGEPYYTRSTARSIVRVSASRLVICEGGSSYTVDCDGGDGRYRSRMANLGDVCGVAGRRRPPLSIKYWLANRGGCS